MFHKGPFLKRYSRFFFLTRYETGRLLKSFYFDSSSVYAIALFFNGSRIKVMTKFIPGLELSHLFYQKEIKPILDKQFPKLKYSAAIIGWGSEVLGFDTAISRDHHWGPRTLLFLSERDYPKFKDKISTALSENIPYEFMGYSTNFSSPEPNGVRHLVKVKSGPLNHMVQIFTIKSFFEARLRFDPYKKISVTDWLTFPQQRLLELTSGAVYYDGLNELEKIRLKFSFYPQDVWLYMLSAQWKKISQEEAFVGRAGDVGDELGSQVVASRIVREIMKLCFLMEKQYAPYSKWFGTAFSKLKIAKKLSPILREVLLADNWKQREKHLVKAYSIVARAHNALDITAAMPTKTTKYYGRPYQVIFAEKFAIEISKKIQEPAVKRIKTAVGSIDQFTDSTDVIENLDMGRSLDTVYK